MFARARAAPRGDVVVVVDRAVRTTRRPASIRAARGDANAMAPSPSLGHDAHGRRTPRVGPGTWTARPHDVSAAERDATGARHRPLHCAAAYANESEVGEALREAFERGDAKREDVFVTSKLWNDRRRPRDVREALMTTLNDLGVGYLDLYLIHWPVAWKRGTVLQPDAEASIAECWSELERCVADGLVRHIGVSNFNEAQLAALCDDPRTKIQPACNQIESHPLWSNDSLVKYSQSKGLTVTAYSPLAQGGELFENEILVGLAKKYGVTPAQVVLRWNVQRDVVVIPKSTSAKRIASNADLFGFELADEAMDAQTVVDVIQSCATGREHKFTHVTSRNRFLRTLGRAISWLPFKFIAMDVQRMGRSGFISLRAPWK